jgi:DNA-binding transcriptional ArsR family regulator
VGENAEPGRETGDVRPNERAQAAVSVEIFLRLLRHARDCFPDDDLETVLIYATVAVSSVSSQLRDLPLLAELGSEPMPRAFKRPTSARAVAASTGLPRETVRRKLRALVESGRVVEEAEGFFSPFDALRQGRNREFAQKIASELIAAERHIRRFEIIT